MYNATQDLYTFCANFSPFNAEIFISLYTFIPKSLNAFDLPIVHVPLNLSCFKKILY